MRCMNLLNASFVCVLAMSTAGMVVAGDYISEKPVAGCFPLACNEATADIFVAEDDWKVARLAVSPWTENIRANTTVKW